MLKRPLGRLFRDLKTHPWLHLLNICTVTISLCVVGGVFLVYQNFNLLTEKTAPELNITAYLGRSLVRNEKLDLIDQVTSMPGVLESRYKTSDEVETEISELIGSMEASKGINAQIFPSLLEVVLDPSANDAQINAVSQFLLKQRFVTDIDVSKDLVSQFKGVENKVRTFGWVFLAIIVFGGGFLIANFMGMRHQARKFEIDVASLMGASRSFVLAPIVLETLLEAMFASGLALATLVLIKELSNLFFAGEWLSMLRIEEWVYLSPGQGVLLVCFALLMTLIGSLTVLLRIRDN